MVGLVGLASHTGVSSGQAHGDEASAVQMYGYFSVQSACKQEFIIERLGEVGGPGTWQMARLVSTLRSGNVHNDKAPTDSPAASLAWEATHLANAVDTLVGGRGAGAGVGAGAVRPTERL